MIASRSLVGRRGRYLKRENNCIFEQNLFSNLLNVLIVQGQGRGYKGERHLGEVFNRKSVGPAKEPLPRDQY
jgi:hypothetical protein